MKIAHEQLLEIINEAVKEALDNADAPKWGSSSPAFAKKRPISGPAAAAAAAAKRKTYVSPRQKKAAAVDVAGDIRANASKATYNVDKTVIHGAGNQSKKQQMDRMYQDIQVSIKSIANNPEKLKALSQFLQGQLRS